MCNFVLIYICYSHSQIWVYEDIDWFCIEMYFSSILIMCSLFCNFQVLHFKKNCTVISNNQNINFSLYFHLLVSLGRMNLLSCVNRLEQLGIIIKIEKQGCNKYYWVRTTDLLYLFTKRSEHVIFSINFLKYIKSLSFLKCMPIFNISV